LLQAADACCRAAKEAGRNRVHAWLDTSRAPGSSAGATQWASRIENALDENRIMLFAQKILPLAYKGQGARCEVLMRMVDEDGSLVLPGTILPTAERFHMSPRIDRWVLRHVLEWMADRRSSLDDVDLIAVNLSGQSLGDKAFHHYALDLMAATSCDVKKLCFELTEASAIANLQDAAEFVRFMRGLGVRFALDHFGAGAAGFGYLETLPVDFLKIDARFIRNLVDSPLDDVAVRGFRDVAAALGIQTVAESIEDEKTRARLQEIGIDFGQGFALHRPERLDAVFAAIAAPPSSSGAGMHPAH
jgi:EAL domain-containing protein (putative c-di-GMP-specific phosphodiesterase class I)